MKRFASPPASQTQRLPNSLRLFCVSCLFLLGMIIGYVWLNVPVSSAATKPQVTDATNQVVERWHGVVTIEETGTSYAGFCPWVCPGDTHSIEVQEWNLQVQEDGSVSGSIRTQLVEYSYNQSRTNNSCGPVAETNFTLENCRFAGHITQPNSMITVQGVREIDQFTQQPVLRLTQQSETQECELLWTARGIHSETGAEVHKEETSKCSRSLYVPQTFTIISYEDGRAPIIPFNDSSGDSSRSGYLTGTTEEPLLELDRELLERSVFLDQVPVEELFTANMNWNSPDGGWVTWQLADAEPERVGPTEVDQLPKPINNGMQGVGKKKLTVQAKSTLNRTSQPEVTQVSVAPPPAWTGGPGQISATKVEGSVVYKSTFKFPEPPFEGTVTVWDVVPWLGGKKFGISETQGSLAWEAQSTSEGQGSLAGQTGLTIMGKGVVGSLGGRARIILEESGVRIPEGGMDFGIAGTIASEPEPLLKVVPSLRPAIIVIKKISSRAAAFINERAQVKLELQPKFDFGFTFFTENDEIKFKNAEAKPGFGFKTVLELKLIEDVLQATASIGGTIAATFQVPEPYFKEAALQGLIQAQIILYRWAWEGEKAWSVVISGASAASQQLWEDLSAAGSWQPLARDYLVQPNYARWRGDVPAAQSVNESIEDLILVENVFPLANPALHARTDSFGNTRLVQAWAHDDPADPALSSGEIVLSRNFGTSWQNPSFLTNDAQDDFAPQAVTLTNNQTLVIWQRMDTTTPPDFNDDPAGYLSHWQIVAQRLGGDPDFEVLSIPGSFNYYHQLGVISDGALAVWLNNPANQLIGDATNPDDILFSRYTSAMDSWSAAAPILADVANLLSLNLATNDTHAAVVFARDMDGDLATTADQELFYNTWNGTLWSAATRLTNNSVADENPVLALDASGAPLLVWRQAGLLKFLQGGWQNTPVNLPLPGAVERPDYELAQGSDGTLALVWQEVGPEDTRIGYAIYDPTRSRWSGELTLTPPADSGATSSMATSIAAALKPADEDAREDDPDAHPQLVLAYQLAHVTTLTRTVDNVETGTGTVDGVTMTNVVQVGQHDLRTATIPLRVNLSVASSDLSVPAADKVQAVIRNTGQLAVENIPVVLHLGSADPVSGATETLAQNIPLLAAGSATTLTFSLGSRSETIFTVEIDPERTLGESDITDNIAILGTDVAITMLPAFYNPLGTTVRARVTQNGNRYVSLVGSSTLTLDEPSGAEVGGGEFSFPIAPTDGITLSAFISTTHLGMGRHYLYWTLDPSDSSGDRNHSNNVAGTVIMVLPDLAAAPERINFGTDPGTTAPFQISVQNLGNWSNPVSSLTVYDGPPGAASSHALLTLPIPAIAPGMEAELSGTLQLAGLPAAASGLTSIHVELDPAGTLDESNENNNSLAAGAVLEGEEIRDDGAWLYMPLLER